MMMPNKNVCLLSHNIHINATDVPRLLKAKKCGIYLWVGHEREHGSTGKRERTHGKVGRATTVKEDERQQKAGATVGHV
jgi:hypothetical protein